MKRRYIIEPRASKKYPWQLVDLKAGLRAGPVSIHETEEKAWLALEAYKRSLRNQAAETRRNIARLKAEGYFDQL